MSGIKNTIKINIVFNGVNISLFKFFSVNILTDLFL